MKTFKEHFITIVSVVCAKFGRQTERIVEIGKKREMALQSLNIKKVWNEELRYEEISINHLLCDADPPGGGGTQKSFIRGGSAPRSNPLPFYIPFFQKRHPFRIPFIGKRHPFHIPSKTTYE